MNTHPKRLQTVTASSSTQPDQVVFIVPDLSKGGGERVTADIIKALIHRGVRTRVLTNELLPELRECALLSFRRIDWRHPIQTAMVLSSEFRRAGPRTCFVAVLTGPMILAGLINLVFRRPLILHEHSDIEQLYLAGTGVRPRLRLAALRLAARSARALVVVSPYLRQRLPGLLGCSPSRVHVVANPLRPFLEKLGGRPEAASVPTIFLIGRDSPEKRFDTATAAVAGSKRVEKIVLVSDIAAGSAREIELRTLAGAKQFVLARSYAEVETIDSRRCALLNFGKAESFSLVIGEWLASGLPVATVPTSNLRSLWEAYRGCHFLANESPAALDEVLELVWQSASQDSRPLYQPTNADESAGALLRLTSDAI